MKILKVGVIPEEVAPLKRQGSCSSCGCVVESNEHELDLYKETPFLGTHNCYVPCPTKGCCFDIRMIPVMSCA